MRSHLEGCLLCCRLGCWLCCCLGCLLGCCSTSTCLAAPCPLCCRRPDMGLHRGCCCCWFLLRVREQLNDAVAAICPVPFHAAHSSHSSGLCGSCSPLAGRPAPATPAVSATGLPQPGWAAVKVHQTQPALLAAAGKSVLRGVCVCLQQQVLPHCQGHSPAWALVGQAFQSVHLDAVPYQNKCGYCADPKTVSKLLSNTGTASRGPDVGLHGVADAAPGVLGLCSMKH